MYHHRNKHASLFTAISEATQYVRKYTVSHPIPASNYSSPACDGLTEIWCDNWGDHDDFFASRTYLEKVKPDEPMFIDVLSVGIVVTEQRTVI